MKQKFLYASIAVLAVAFLLMIAPLYDIGKVDLEATFLPISNAHWLGTDNLGKDILSLIVSGIARTLAVVLIASTSALGVGVCLGLVSGYFGGLAETIIQFLTDLLMIVPSFILALIITYAFGLNPLTAGLAIGISDIGDYANQAAVLTKGVKSNSYITIQKILGIPRRKIILHHLLPNIIPPILTSLGNKAGGITLQFAALSFMGLGSDITKPDLGAMLYQYRIYVIEKPGLIFWPTAGIFILSFFFQSVFDDPGRNLQKRGSLYE